MIDCPKCDGTSVSAMRRSIIAPPGHVIVVRDLSQIEARVLAWLAEQADLLDEFRRSLTDKNIDVYCSMASTIFSRPIEKKKDKTERFIGKTTILGCLGGSTRVLTNNGWKYIVNVKVTDMLWDGEQWVAHEGLISRGLKTTVTQYGVTATEDHEILTGHGWQDWGGVHKSHSLFLSALCRARSQSLRGNAMRENGANQRDGNLLLGVNAAGKAELIGKTSKQDAQLGAINARKYRVAPRGNVSGGMRPLFLKNRTVYGYLTGFRLVLADAITRKQRDMQTTEGAEFLYTHPGVKTTSCSSRILLLSSGGTTQKKNSIEKTTTKGTSQTTYSSRRENRICRIGAQYPHYRREYKSLRQRTQTYDLAYVGENNRFMILSSAGPIIVHNCGYGLGWRTYQERLRVGMLGDKGRILDGTVAQSLGVSPEIFLSNAYKQKFVKESLPLGSDFYVHATHCACCEAIINLFRANKEKIPEFWNVCSEALARIYAGETWKFGKDGVLSTCPEGILLPNGMKIRYVELQQKQEKNRVEYIYLKERKTHYRVKTYGGSVTENVVQALSRIVLTDAMLKCKRDGIRIVHTVHDELLAVCREDEGSDVYRRMGEIMDKPPAWCADLPLASDGGWNMRYQK